MASRSSAPYNAPYNPAEWGPISSGSTYPQQSTQLSGLRVAYPPPPPRPADIIPSPPPPYSPRNHPPSPGYVPGSQAASPAVSPSGPVALPGATSGTASRPLSVVSLNDGSSPWQPSYVPPPPPPPGPPPRASSLGATDRRQIFPDPTGIEMGSSPGQFPGVPPRSSLSYQFHRDEPPLQPPAAKRAVSAGAVPSSSRQSHSPLSGRSWGPGMPLPPPPPGPPPTVRSQSAGASSRESSWRAGLSYGVSSNQQQASAAGDNQQSSAAWTDETARQSAASKTSLRIDTRVGSRPSQEPQLVRQEERPPSPAKQGSGGGLFRSLAIRESSAKGIRERRMESRSRRQSEQREPPSPASANNPWADALEKLTAQNSEAGVGEQEVSRTQLSGRNVVSDDVPESSRSRASSGLFSHRGSVPTRSEAQRAHGANVVQTPPFSPGRDPQSPSLGKPPAYGFTPKTLPTPPPNSGLDLRYRARSSTRSDERSSSQLSNGPNESISSPVPLSPRPTSVSRHILTEPTPPASVDPAEALQRYQEFLDRETTAKTEEEALKIFAEFVISECRVRRQLYSQVFEEGSFDVNEWREKLFSPAEENELGGPDATTPDGNYAESIQETRSTDTGISVRRDSAWWNSYRPSLSPIQSISIENESSRGRPPSRWWESKTGSSSEGGERRAQRSRRETKYMGVSRELREAMQMGYGDTLLETDEERLAAGAFVMQSNNEYPPEKVGWHESNSSDAPQSVSGQTAILDTTPVNEGLDISRLVTLPPPYPRHHPAVNNSHPDLVAYRTTVRAITDLTEIKATRERHRLHVERLQQDHLANIRENRRQFSNNIQQQIEQGSITFAEAAEAEAALGIEEKQMERALVHKIFDSYQNTVLKPMRAILMERVKKATDSIEELSGNLSEAARHETPDQTQEEGDEKPELLEKLTQLKWLFEAREQLYREMYELQSESHEKYRAVVSLPYKQDKNEDKLRETDAFFIRDALDRRVEYETEALQRIEQFMDVIEENVKRGVETHLSAFWDIAPPLLDLVQQIPDDLDNLRIKIPPAEYQENPSYHEFPLQYLYSLLCHAEKSTYQFIESQTNLLCLLHEVKSGVMTTSCRLTEARRIRQGDPEDVVRQDVQAQRAREEQELTADLKDRVATVEGQWTEALGSQIQALRERVKSRLIAQGGWDDMENLI